MGPVRIHVLMMKTLQRCGFNNQHSKQESGFLSFSPQHMWKIYTNFISPADFSSSTKLFAEVSDQSWREVVELVG